MVKGIVFFEEYFNFMDDLTPEQFCEFMRLIQNLRFKGIDTKVEDVEDRDVRLVWRSVRPSILKSRNNAKDYEKKNKPKQEEPAIEVSELGNPINITVTKEDLEDEPEPKKQRNYCGTFEDAVTRLKNSPKADWYRIANQYSSKCGYNVQELINAAS